MLYVSLMGNSNFLEVIIMNISIPLRFAWEIRRWHSCKLSKKKNNSVWDRITTVRVQCNLYGDNLYKHEQKLSSVLSMLGFSNKRNDKLYTRFVFYWLV